MVVVQYFVFYGCILASVYINAILKCTDPSVVLILLELLSLHSLFGDLFGWCFCSIARVLFFVLKSLASKQCCQLRHADAVILLSGNYYCSQVRICWFNDNIFSLGG